MVSEIGPHVARSDNTCFFLRGSSDFSGGGVRNVRSNKDLLVCMEIEDLESGGGRG